jgi:aldose 1-epimerase
VWKAESIKDKDSVGVKLSYLSKDGEMGFPGNLKTEVTYRLNDRNELHIDYTATTDKPTVLNLTNHSYFNLAGAGNGDILKQVATLHASHYTPVNATLIPTGELAPVKGTPMDFLKPTPIGQHIKEDHPQLKFAEPKQGGFDFNWALDTKGDVKQLAAEVHDPASGRRLQLFTTEPGVQFYTSNFLDGSVKGKAGKTYQHWSGFTLETQHFPDAPNQPKFASTRLNPGQTYTQNTVFKFTVD